MFAQRHLNKGILKVQDLATFLLFQPDFVETLATDAAAEMGMELWFGSYTGLLVVVLYCFSKLSDV